MTDQTPPRTCLAVVLAAGEGTRMKSALPKVLHEVAGRSMLGHVVAAVGAAGATHVAVVVGPDRDDVSAEARTHFPGAETFVQRDRLGTAHAVLAARDALLRGYDDVIVAFADTPLLTPGTFQLMRERLESGAAVVGLGFDAADPTGYGRMVASGEDLEAIIEHKDASEAQRQIRLCNAGLLALAGQHALAILERVGNDNAQKEYYLTDAPEIARRMGLRATVMTAPESEVQGVNDRVQLAGAEATMQVRLRNAAMRAGATMLDPASVCMNHDTKLGRDVIVESHVVFGKDVIVDDNAVIHAFSHLEGARVRAGAHVGPFARLRPGADLGERAKVGNFVEIKASTLGMGAKVGHLAYIGDASVGDNANVGAGTITCNYDGHAKFRTVIGAGTFIGSNSSLVAPVTIADGAYVGSGTVVTRDVPADALAVARPRQTNIDGWATSFRARKAAVKQT